MPIVLGVAIWLIVRRWRELSSVPKVGGSLLISAPLFIGVTFLYINARIYDRTSVIYYATFLLFVLTIYYINGRRFLLAMTAPLIALLLAIPPPPWILDVVTQGSKIWATDAAIKVLNFIGLSAVKDGFNILIDQYILTVKDACSGVNSLISLSWAGFVYVYLRRAPHLWYYLIMVTPIIIMAELANTVRILILVLLTHTFGDGVAQGVLHETAGILMFTTALIGVISLVGGVSLFLSRIPSDKAQRRS